MKLFLDINLVPTYKYTYHVLGYIRYHEYKDTWHSFVTGWKNYVHYLYIFWKSCAIKLVVIISLLNNCVIIILYLAKQLAIWFSLVVVFLFTSSSGNNFTLNKLYKIENLSFFLNILLKVSKFITEWKWSYFCKSLCHVIHVKLRK